MQYVAGMVAFGTLVLVSHMNLFHTRRMLAAQLCNIAAIQIYLYKVLDIRMT